MSYLENMCDIFTDEGNVNDSYQIICVTIIIRKYVSMCVSYNIYSNVHTRELTMTLLDFFFYFITT